MKKFNFFILSALCFLIANNLHYVVDVGIVAKILDILATGLFFFGLYKNYLS